MYRLRRRSRVFLKDFLTENRQRKTSL